MQRALFTRCSRVNGGLTKSKMVRRSAAHTPPRRTPNQQDVHAQSRQDRARHPQPRRHDQRAQFVWQGPGE